MRPPSSSVVLAACLLGLVALAGVVRPGSERAAWGTAELQGHRPDALAEVASASTGHPGGAGPSVRSAWARNDLHECKPQGPLAVALEQLEAWGADGRLELSVDVESFVPLSDVRVRVLLPDGGEILDDPSTLLASDGGWVVPPRAGPTSEDAARFGASPRGTSTQDVPGFVADDGRRALIPGQRVQGRLALRLPPGAASSELVVEAEGTFGDADGLDERVVVQRRLVWGEPDDPIAPLVVTDRSTGATRRSVVLPVFHRPER